MLSIKNSVFISFQRTQTKMASAIQKNLMLRGYDVIFDYKDHYFGDYEQFIRELIETRTHFLILLSPSTLEISDLHDDWLGREIEIALDKKCNIIPIVLDGFDLDSPEAKKLFTGKLASLGKHNCLCLHAGSFEEGMDRLCNQFLNLPFDSVMSPENRSISPNIKQFVKEQRLSGVEEKLVDENPLSAIDWFKRACTTKEPERAIKLYTKAVELDSLFALAYICRGFNYSLLKMYEHAIEDYNQGIKLDPTNGSAFYNRGNCYAHLKQLEQAIEDYGQAIKLDPKNTRAFNKRGLRYADLKEVRSSA